MEHVKIIDLRSDTVTKPTKEMRKAAFDAEVGDDVFGDDPTVNELEDYAANLVGMEDALFVSSGTQGNLVCVTTHTQNGDEVLLDEDSHIYYYEVGGMSYVGGVIPRLFQTDRGKISREELETFIRPDNIHFPDLSLLCLENTHNRHGGVALSPNEIKEMASVAKDHNLKVHLDGARIFNAVEAHECDITDYTSSVDSIQFCLSKGLSAPVGSIVAGSEEFIKKARKKRKVLGGGMRQAGIIAAPGLIALKEMRKRLILDHQNANLLHEELVKLGLEVWPTDTNIVVCQIPDKFSNASDAINALQENGVLTVSFGDNLVRMTTHRHITREDIIDALSRIENAWI